jgi:hypothetical protein
MGDRPAAGARPVAIVANVVTGIAAALSAYPQARQRVIEYLRTADETIALPLPAPDVIDVAAVE